MTVTINCTSKCEAMPACAVCRRRRAPQGRSIALEMHGSLCDDDCEGYRKEPTAGHLWPGELARSRER